MHPGYHEKLNVPEPPAETMRKFIGPPLTLSIREYCGITGEKAMEFVEEYRSIYNVEGVFEAEVFDGMFPFWNACEKPDISWRWLPPSPRVPPIWFPIISELRPVWT